LKKGDVVRVKVGFIIFEIEVVGPKADFTFSFFLMLGNEAAVERETIPTSTL